MNQDELRILARTECLILWDRLAKDGSNNKKDTLLILYNEGKVSQPIYSFDCPFCGYLRIGRRSCKKCIWPFRKRATYLRCTIETSPFNKWVSYYYSQTSIKRKKYAKQVFDLIYSIDI